MIYKEEDKVRIKTWEEMKKEYGVSYDGGNINCNSCCFTKGMEKDVEELNCNRILTIENVFSDFYIMKEIYPFFSDDMIKCLAKDDLIKNDTIKNDIKSEPITSRFEILDIR